MVGGMCEVIVKGEEEVCFNCKLGNFVVCCDIVGWVVNKVMEGCVVIMRMLVEVFYEECLLFVKLLLLVNDYCMGGKGD